MQVVNGIEYYAFYNNEAKLIQKCAQRKIQVLYNSTYSDKRNKRIFCHELGHALGYKGHSSYNLHVMWDGPNELNELLALETTHLKQIYDLMN